jgi:hypothetical protein
MSLAYLLWAHTKHVIYRQKSQVGEFLQKVMERSDRTGREDELMREVPDCLLRPAELRIQNGGGHFEQQ